MPKDTMTAFYFELEKESENVSMWDENTDV